MKHKVSFIQMTTRGVTFHPSLGEDYRIGKRHYKSPSEDSLYRLLNNSMVSDIVPSYGPDGLLLEITPRSTR